MITSRDEQIRRTAVNALQQGRALADALSNLATLPKAVGSASWDDGLRALESGDILATDVAGLVSHARTVLMHHLDQHGPSYGTLVFTRCSDDYPLAHPEGERLRQVAELLKFFTRSRQELIDLQQADRLLATSGLKA